MRIEVLGRRGRVVARWVVCSLCEELRLPREMDVFEGPGQQIPCCVHCIAEFESWCEGRGIIDADAEAEAA